MLQTYGILESKIKKYQIKNHIIIMRQLSYTLNIQIIILESTIDLYLEWEDFKLSLNDHNTSLLQI